MCATADVWRPEDNFVKLVLASTFTWFQGLNSCLRAFMPSVSTQWAILLTHHLYFVLLFWARVFSTWARLFCTVAVLLFHLLSAGVALQVKATVFGPQCWS